MSENFAGGPRSAAGRARSAQNARRHGLASCVTFDPALTPEIDRLAQAFAGPGADPLRQYHARRVAQAQVDLNRIRLARHETLQRTWPLRMPRPPATRKLLFVWRYLRSGGEPNAITHAIVRRLRPVELRPGEMAAGRLKELNALERYERRAYSRRRSALRAMDDAAFLAERTGQARSAEVGPVFADGEGLGQPEPDASAAATPPNLAERTRAGRTNAAQAAAGEGQFRPCARVAPGATPDLAERTAGAGPGSAALGAETSAPGPASGTRPAGGAPAPAGRRRSPQAAARPAEPAERMPDLNDPLYVPARIRSMRQRYCADQDAEDADAAALAEQTGGAGKSGVAATVAGVRPPPRSPRWAGHGAPPASLRGDVLEWTWRGQSPDQIARRLHLPEDELRRIFAEELESAASLIQLEVSRCVNKRARSSDVTAAIYILKTFAGWGKPPPPPPRPPPLSDDARRNLIDRVMQLIERPRDGPR